MTDYWLKVTIKNIVDGPRGFNTQNGPESLERNEERTARMTLVEIENSRRTGWFEITEEAADD